VRVLTFDKVEAFFDAGVETIELGFDLDELNRMVGGSAFNMAKARNNVVEPMFHAIKLPAHMTQMLNDKIFVSAIISSFQTG
jgi:hypothetical protein